MVMQRLFVWIASQLRPLHDNGLPEELQYGEIEYEDYIRGEMLRTAHLSHGVDVAFGIFQLIGLQYARRADRAWRPRELLLMEDVSLAYSGVWRRLDKGQAVPPIHVDRTVEALFRYFQYLGEERSREELRELIDQHIQRELADWQPKYSDTDLDN
jgi:hypothetical protein